MTLLSAVLVSFSLWLSGVPQTPIPTKSLEGFWLADGYGLLVSIIESKYVHGGLHPYCKDHIQFGIVGNEIGYLRITTFYDYVDVEGYADELQCLQRSLDTIFSGTEKLNSLVIDVRLNHGGDDPLGIEIASRLTQERYLAYDKVARNNRNLDTPVHFTERQDCWVVPSTRPGFKRRVALLIGPDTVSAGETFTMALCGRKPQVVLIGLNTQGVFSDVLNRSLPNGWHFHLPNEVYLTANGQAFDGTGVPPDIRVPFFIGADLQSGRDAALEEAIRSESPVICQEPVQRHNLGESPGLGRDFRIGCHSVSRDVPPIGCHLLSDLSHPPLRFGG